MLSKQNKHDERITEPNLAECSAPDQLSDKILARHRHRCAVAARTTFRQVVMYGVCRRCRLQRKSKLLHAHTTAIPSLSMLFHACFKLHCM